MKKCQILNCNNLYYGKGYCYRHYWQFREHGYILERTRVDAAIAYNNATIKYFGEYARINII